MWDWLWVFDCEVKDKVIFLIFNFIIYLELSKILIVFFKFCFFKFDIIEKSVLVIKKKFLILKGFKNKMDYLKKELLYFFN